METKICIRCGKNRNIKEYYTFKVKIGINTRKICKKCWRKKSKQYRIDNPNYEKDRYLKNIDYNKQKGLESYYKNKDNADFKLKRREYQLLIHYNITLEEYNIILKSQDYKCKICKTLAKETRGNGLLHVDHCHKTGKIRGLLCHHCNMGLGSFKDSSLLLEEAVKYLDDFKNGH
jgi:hypothetical protein